MAKWMLGLLVCGVCLAQPGAKNPFESSAADIDVGRATFRIYCSPCHGIRAEGGRGPDLTLGDYASGNSDEEVYDVVAEGVPGTEMPGFGARMAEDSVWRIVAYLRSVARRETAAILGDPRAGEQIFWGTGQCAPCHRVGSRGGRLGPDLSRVGRSRSLAYLRESLAEPSADITSGYNTIVIVTRDGKTVTGVEKNFDNFSAQLLDAREEIHSFLRDEVQSIRKQAQSMMPSYAEVLSDSERNDLVAYLTSLRGEEGKP